MGRPCAVDLALLEWWFHIFCFLLWQFILGRPGLLDIFPSRMAISQISIPTLTAHIRQTRCGRSIHPAAWWFHIIWFLLCQLILGTPGLADIPPSRMVISQILIPTLRAHIRQTRCGRSIPPAAWWFHIIWFLVWQLILGRPVLADLLPID